MKLYKEDEENGSISARFLQRGKPMEFHTLEPIDITELRNMISDAMDNLATAISSPGNVDVHEHVEGLLSKLKGEK